MVEEIFFRDLQILAETIDRLGGRAMFPPVERVGLKNFFGNVHGLEGSPRSISCKGDLPSECDDDVTRKVVTRLGRHLWCLLVAAASAKRN